MKMINKLLLSAVLTTILSGTTFAAGLSGMASDALKDQAVDKTVDTGASMAKEQLKAGAPATDAASSATSGDVSDAASNAVKDQATDAAIDKGAEMAKGTAKKLIK